MTSSPPIQMNELLIESIDASLIEEKEEDKIAIKISIDRGDFSIDPALKVFGIKRQQPNFIYWIWGEKKTFFEYLNLVVYQLKGTNLDDYLKEVRTLFSRYDYIDLLKVLWREYRDKPDELIEKPMKEINYVEMIRLFMDFKERYEELYFQFTGERLQQSILTKVPSFQRKDIFKNLPYNTDTTNLYMLDTYQELWKDIHSLWFIGFTISRLFNQNPVKIPKKVVKNIIQLVTKIVNNTHFQKLINIFQCIVKPSTEIFENIQNNKINIINSGKYCSFKEETLTIIIPDQNGVDYLKQLLVVLQNMMKMYHLIFVLNKRDALFAFLLNKYDISINKNNKNSFSYNIGEIQRNIQSFIQFIQQNESYLKKPGGTLNFHQLQNNFGNAVEQSKKRSQNVNRTEFNQLVSILQNPLLGLRLNIEDIRKKFKKLNKYQRDTIVRLIKPPTPPNPRNNLVLLDYQGEFVFKRINTTQKIKTLFDFYTIDETERDYIVKKHELFGKL